MWVVGFFLFYLLLALLIPAFRVLVPVWRKARICRPLRCPFSGRAAVIELDPWYAIRMHALGDRELRVKDCSGWPEGRACGQSCLVNLRAV